MSTSPIKSVECANCGTELVNENDLPVDDRTKCPGCGGTSRLFKVTLSSTVRVTSMLSGKARSPDSRKPFVEFKSGDSYSWARGIWAKLIRRIDRRSDSYYEKVFDPETGDIIHFCDEPLSDHQGHGSARRKDS